MEQAVGVRILPPEFGFFTGWSGVNGKRTELRRQGAGQARWGFDSPLQYRVREWCNWQTHRPQKAAFVSSNLTSRTNYSNERA